MINLLLLILELLSANEITSCFLFQTTPAILHQRAPQQHDDASPSTLLTSLSEPLLLSSGVVAEPTTEEETRTVLTTRDFPYRVCISSSQQEDDDDDHSWIHQAIQYLRENGVCVLYSDSNDKEQGPTSVVTTCNNANDAALSRLSFLKQRIKGVDANKGVFRFQEVVSRDLAGGRFDMPVTWMSQAQQSSVHNDDDHDDGFLSCSGQESNAFFNFHTSVQDAVQPIIDELWKDDQQDSHVAASGFLINQPGSKDQTWHRDGPNAGLINVFVPLVDLTLDIGPTEVWTNTHHDDTTKMSKEEGQKIAPLLKTGQILMMDYRTFHRGLGNSCSCENNTTRTVAYAVWHKGASSLADKLSYGLLPRAYPSIQEAAAADKSSHDRRENEDAPFRVHASPNDCSWIKKAATLLQHTGACVLDDNDNYNGNTPLLCQDINLAALDRLVDLQQRISNRGVDQTEPFRFLELVKKDIGRYDMPVSWKNEGHLGTPLTTSAAESVINFHSWMEGLIQPVLNQIWEDEAFSVAKSGVIVNQPGSLEYQWSRKCANKGYIQAFAPLVDLNDQGMGPTEVWPKSHLPGDHPDSKPMLPLLKRGQILLMDRRILYQYPANTLKEWAMVYALFQKGNSRGDYVQGMSDALTLEYD